MANLQVKNVPDALHRKLRRQAQREGRTIRDLVLEALRRVVAREEFRQRLTRRTPVEFGLSVTRVLDEVRAERDAELGG